MGRTAAPHPRMPSRGCRPGWSRPGWSRPGWSRPGWCPARACCRSCSAPGSWGHLLDFDLADADLGVDHEPRGAGAHRDGAADAQATEVAVVVLAGERSAVAAILVTDRDL